ncbi:MAG: MFS transporter, partial [Pseudomonadota bacterium]
AYVAGTGVGLLMFGALGARIGRWRSLVGGLVGFSVLSLLGALSPNMGSLLGIRFFQGVMSAGPAVFAPGIIRSLFDEAGATRALGALGSVESLVPGAAPIAGLWLLEIGGWALSFLVTASLGLVLAIVLGMQRSMIPPAQAQSGGGSYYQLLKSPTYLRYALSQACVLGGLLIFVFGAPAVITSSMGGEIIDFIRMQVVGVACFILASNLAGLCVTRFGAEQMIWFGTALAVAAALGLFGYALIGGKDTILLSILFAPLNAGLGLRGPPGFLRAIIAGGDNDDRAASLMILAIFGVSAGGTALFAPFLETGLIGLSAACLITECCALALLWSLPKL